MGQSRSAILATMQEFLADSTRVGCCKVHMVLLSDYYTQSRAEFWIRVEDAVTRAQVRNLVVSVQKKYPHYQVTSHLPVCSSPLTAVRRRKGKVIYGVRYPTDIPAELPRG